MIAWLRRVNLIRVGIGVVAIMLVAVLMIRWRPSPPPRVTVMPSETPPPVESSPPLLAKNRHYREGAYLAIDAALHASARAAKSGRYEDAAAVLDASNLAKDVGIVAEKYVGARIEARPGPLDTATATTLGLSLFDASYATGTVGARGIRVGRVLIDANGSPASAFANEEAHAAFGTLRVLSLMEPWIRIWQDVGGVRPISELTPLYLATRSGNGKGWSDVDVIATMHDLGMSPPPVLVRDARFPEWAPFEDWLSRRPVGTP